MEREITIDKVNAYLDAPLFPWNFLLEPVSEKAVRHYLRFAIPVAIKKVEVINPENHDSVKLSIEEETRNIANDYLIDPNNRHAIKIHGGLADEYPFAYAQCYVFSMLYGMVLKLEDLIDIEALLNVMGVTKSPFMKKVELIEELVENHRKVAPSGIRGTEMLGRKVMCGSDATEYGVLHGIVFSSDHSVFLELIVKPLKKDKKSPFRKEGKFVYIPIEEVRLANTYNNHIVLNY